MQPVKFLAALVVLFVWGYVFETFLSPTVYGNSMSMIPGLVAEPSVAYAIFGAILGSAVLIWVYEKVKGSFAPGLAGGAVFGLYTGILMNFPLWLYFSLYVAWPYRAMWHFTLVGIVLGVINGMLIGLVYEKVGVKAA